MQICSPLSRAGFCNAEGIYIAQQPAQGLVQMVLAHTWESPYQSLGWLTPMTPPQASGSRVHIMKEPEWFPQPFLA